MKKLCVIAITVVLLIGVSAGVGSPARSGRTLNFVAPYGGDLLGLDPHKSTRVQDFLVMSNINRSLYFWEPGVNKPKLELATKADISPDWTVWTFRLRNDVKFHNGRKMTADDIIYSYNRLASPATKSPSTLYVRIIKGAKDVEDGKAHTIAGLRKLDDFGLQITLENPVDLPYFLFYPGTAIVPKEEVEKKGASPRWAMTTPRPARWAVRSGPTTRRPSCPPRPGRTSRTRPR